MIRYIFIIKSSYVFAGSDIIKKDYEWFDSTKNLF
jgi:hypothetical protein